MKRILTLIRKELIGVWRDPKTRISLLAPPLIQLFIFAFAATLDVKNVPIGILNHDQGKASFELIQRFRGSPMFTSIIYLDHQKQIVPFIDQQKGIMVLSIDEEFSRHLEAGKEARIQLILDGRKSNSAQIILGYASSIINRFNSDIETEAQLHSTKAQLVPRNWFNPNLIYYWFNIPSLVATLSMLTCLVVTSISVAREKELGTFDQLLVSPLIPFEVLMGKMIPGILVGVLEGLLMLLVGVFIFQIPFTGSFLLFFLSLLVFIIFIAGVGLFMSSLAATQQQAMVGTFVIMGPSVLISGFATPIENMPPWLQPLTSLVPLKYMLVISKGIFLKNLDGWIVLHNLWPLALIALCTLTTANFLFHRRLQ